MFVDLKDLFCVVGSGCNNAENGTKVKRKYWSVFLGEAVEGLVEKGT